MKLKFEHRHGELHTVIKICGQHCKVAWTVSFERIQLSEVILATVPEECKNSCALIAENTFFVSSKKAEKSKWNRWWFFLPWDDVWITKL